MYMRQAKKLNILNHTLHSKIVNANAKGMDDDYVNEGKNYKKEQEVLIKNRGKSHHHKNNKNAERHNLHGPNMENVNIALKIQHPFPRILSQSSTELINIKRVNAGMVHNNVDATISSRASQYTPKPYDVLSIQ